MKPKLVSCIEKENNFHVLKIIIENYSTGWSVYIKRRTAVQKISSLSEASYMELQNFDDVCAICYQEMTSAKITRCKHYFHGVCLRKWLYVQDKVNLKLKIFYFKVI